jgi:hypothetical protein
MFTIIGRRFGVVVAAATAVVLLSSCSFSFGTGGEPQASGSGGVGFRDLQSATIQIEALSPSEGDMKQQGVVQGSSFHRTETH